MSCNQIQREGLSNCRCTPFLFHGTSLDTTDPHRPRFHCRNKAFRSHSSRCLSIDLHSIPHLCSRKFLSRFSAICWWNRSTSLHWDTLLLCTLLPVYEEILRPQQILLLEHLLRESFVRVGGDGWDCKAWKESLVILEFGLAVHFLIKHSWNYWQSLGVRRWHRGYWSQNLLILYLR